MGRVPRFATFTTVAAFLVASALPWALASSGASDTAELESTLTGSIYISGNENFTAENGVVSGAGSSGDPYIIEGWEIVFNNTGTAITVVSTDSYFVIRDVQITGAKIGIRFEQVFHGRVTSSSIVNCTTGLTASYSENSKVDNNLFSNCSVAVFLRYCDAFKVTDNTFLDNEEDMRVIALPWIETRQADLVFGIIAASLFGFVALVIYMRVKHSGPPEERP